MCGLSSLSIYYPVDDYDWMKVHKIKGKCINPQFNSEFMEYGRNTCPKFTMDMRVLSCFQYMHIAK